ncbi:LOW QUALITY PROTEIN: transferrin-like [Tachypleus tridentatus]|uniref:LOW QUALITY PROTEIN: transferrin-like n=1 Tax=Tachypleus tridentatus TaxID=6853 RepID=UPI003FD5885C
MVPFVFIFLQGFLRIISSQPVRLCVPGKNIQSCLSMSQEMPNYVQCVEGRDKLGCMSIILDGKADLVNIGPEEIYVGGRHFNLVPIAMEATGYEVPYKYRATAVVKKDLRLTNLADLRSKRSCHGSFNDVAGWHVPVSALSMKKILTPDCWSDLHSMESFFMKSCIGGSWSPDPALEERLKQRHPQLCNGCGKETSCLDKRYSGHEGALHCLVSSGNDIAFTTVEATEKFFKNRKTLANKYEYLCLNSTTDQILNTNPCYWARIPSNAFVGIPVSDEEKNRLVRVLQQIFTRYTILRRPPWGHEAFVSSENVTNIVPVPPTMATWNDYLGSTFLNTIEKENPGCEENVVSICVTSVVANRKCNDLRKAAFAWRLKPEIRCINHVSEAECMEVVKSHDADVIILNSDDIYRAGRYYGLKPVVGERYNDSDISSWAVAVVRRGSNIKRLSELKGRQSCHKEMMDTSGWTAPVSRLMDARLVTSNVCDVMPSIAEFFSASCVPGAADRKLNLNTTGADVLCRLCKGNQDGRHVCAQNERERYYGNDGAFRCLVEGRGDVAFIDHEWLEKFYNNEVNGGRVSQLQTEDLQLLCPSGGQARIEDYKFCHMMAIPAKHVMMSNFVSEKQKANAVELLVNAGYVFGPEASTFRMFGNYQNISDLLFSDTTTRLEPLPDYVRYRDVLGEEFLHMMEAVDMTTCVTSAGRAITESVQSFLLALLCVTFWVLKTDIIIMC